jgi:hypothetical protein
VSLKNLLIIDVVDGSFVTVSRTEVVSELLNVPCTAVGKHLTEFNAEVLFPLILTYDDHKMGVLVLLDYFCHSV